VLVADARRLEWKGQADEQLKAVVTGAIQLATVRERAAAAGISPGTLAALLALVPVTSVQLGSAPGRSPGDEMAVLVMTVVLFSLRDVWRDRTAPGSGAAGAGSRDTEAPRQPVRAGFIAAATRMVSLWTRHSGPPPRDRAA